MTADRPSASDSAFIALGSNQGNPISTLHQAMDRLEAFADTPLLRSSLWRSTPVGCPLGSPEFVNAVVGLFPRAGETPESLLAKLQALETEFGRQRGTVRNAPRPLDLDLIAFDSELRNTAEFILPHPRAHLRQFVLQPLSEIAPALVLPGQTLSVARLLAALDSGERVVRLPD